MRELAAFGPLDAHAIEGLLFDLDDTVLSGGLLTRQAYDALWMLHNAGFKLVAVTGRPSGWAEVIARQWPIDGAVAENGAVHVFREGRAIAVRVNDSATFAYRQERLSALKMCIASLFPGVSLADDHMGRRADIAWDVAECTQVSEPVVVALMAAIQREGARVTRSSVHVHASFERDDKASGAVAFARERWNMDPGAALHRFAFVGDSTNDASCFAAFRTTFGVANVRRYARVISVPPRWVAPSSEGVGFAEIAHALVAARARPREA